MKHLTNELDGRRFVWVLLFEVHDESEGTVFEGCVGGTDDYCIPVEYLVRRLDLKMGVFAVFLTKS